MCVIDEACSACVQINDEITDLCRGCTARSCQYNCPKGAVHVHADTEMCIRDSTSIPDHENLSMHSAVPEKVKEALMSQYKHPIHQELEETAKKLGGHRCV